MLKPPSDKISAETREKLLALAEFVESDDKHGFWMQHIRVGGLDVAKSDAPECGSACCLIGFSNALYSRADDIISCPGHLGITRGDAHALFLPPSPHRQSNDRTKAVRVLRHFAYTGEVDWRV